MKFYPSTDPRSKFFPKEDARYEEHESRRARILRIRAMAQSEPNLIEAAKLHRMADQLAQDQLQLRTEKPKKQRRLFDPDTLD